MQEDTDGRALSVSEAAARGIAGLVKEAEAGQDVIVSRRGQPVAALIGMARLQELRRLESELRDVALVLSRAATDTGERTALDDTITAFGYSRAELEAELESDLRAGRD